MQPTVESYGPTDAADIALCKYVYEALEKFYPNHGWMVGANSEAGTVTIDLPYEKPPHLQRYGWLMHITSVDAPDNVKRIMRAGGELLERFGLARKGATAESKMRARESFDIDNPIGKSRY